MKQFSWQLFRIKVALSLKTLVWLFRKIEYSVLALAIALIFFELVYWLFNLSVISSILTSEQLSIGNKLSVLMSPFTSLQSQNGLGTFIFMLILAVIQGLSLAALIYAMRHQTKTDSALLGGSVFLGFLAVVGLGCPACGTSLITPVVTLFVSTSAVSISEQITAVALPVAVIVGLYGLYVSGLRLSTIKMANTPPPAA